METTPDDVWLVSSSNSILQPVMGIPPVLVGRSAVKWTVVYVTSVTPMFPGGPGVSVKGKLPII